nr:MAG TPA: hypothetical protein [Bacteriophage sp.]
MIAEPAATIPKAPNTPGITLFNLLLHFFAL